MNKKNQSIDRSNKENHNQMNKERKEKPLSFFNHPHRYNSTENLV